MEEHNAKFLVSGMKTYLEAWPDYNQLKIEPSFKDQISPDELVRFGFQRWLVYREETYQGPFKKEKPLSEARSECFAGLISDLEKLADGADFVLVEVATDKGTGSGWLIQAYAQAMLKKQG